MPIFQDAFCEAWQKTIRTADVQKQMWFLAAVFGGKTPVVVNPNSIEINYNSESDNYIISSKGKKVELPGKMMVALMDKVAPPAATVPQSSQANASVDNNYSSSSKPPSKPPPSIPVPKAATNQYGVLPKKKDDATHTYGPVNAEEPVSQYGTVARVKAPNEGVMANINDIKPLTTTASSASSSSASSTPAFNPVTTGGITTRAAALTKAADRYGSSSAAVAAGKVGNAIYGEMPQQPPPTEAADKAVSKSEPKKR